MRAGRFWFLVAAAGFALTSGCATFGDGAETQGWRKVTQTAKRFAVFVNEPGTPREGDLVTFKMRYVYMPGEVKHEDKEVAWQEYHAMTVNCAENTVKVGARTRYAPDGSTLAQDDNQTFDDILWGVAADDAARAKCKQDYWIGNVVIPNGPDWMDEARKHIAATTPPNRP